MLIFISLIELAGFSYFLKKEVGLLPALMFSILFAGSSYLISMSSFAINGVIGFPFILLWIFSLYEFFKTKKPIYLFLIFFSLGNIFEAEVPFGIFTIPAFFITLVLTGQIKNFFGEKKNLIYSLTGLVIPFGPRILFELKNHFLQTRTFLGYFLHPQLHSPQSFSSIVTNRIGIFNYYFGGSLPASSPVIILIFVLLSIYGIYFVFKKSSSRLKMLVKFLIIFLAALFAVSFFYRDIFWTNYFEGLSLYFIVFMSISLSTINQAKNKYVKLLPLAILFFLFAFNFYAFAKDINNRQPVADVGMREQLKTLNYLETAANHQSICVRVYTPPIIPYTYDYLFDYYVRTGKIKSIGQGYVDDKCFYVIENDQYKFRIDQFRKDNIPQGAKLLSIKKITDNVKVELWKFP